MSDKALINKIKSKFGASVQDEHDFRDDQTVTVDKKIIRELIQWLRDDPDMDMDFLMDLTCVDYLQRKPVRFEVVYHLFSMEKKVGPLVLKQRVMSRENPTVTSLTPIYRGAELMEREVYDLFGITFTGHPDLRRILMWDNFEHHPMRKDYQPPNDYDYEPTPHAEVIERAERGDYVVVQGEVSRLTTGHGNRLIVIFEDGTGEVPLAVPNHLMRRFAGGTAKGGSGPSGIRPKIGKEARVAGQWDHAFLDDKTWGIRVQSVQPLED